MSGRAREFPAGAAIPPWHFLYFSPLPQGRESFRPGLGMLALGCMGDDIPRDYLKT